MPTLKIAICQLSIDYLNFEHNMAAARRNIIKAASCQADVIVFPEMTFTGFSMETGKTALYAQETISCMRQLASEYHITIGFGWTERRESTELAENHYGFMTPDGTLTLNYTKIHPFSYASENCYFKGGDALAYATLGGIPVSTVICYDLRFPELFRIASQRASVIFVPANWPATRKKHWETLLHARAIENQVYIVGINCTGTQEKLRYSGGSEIINPNGDSVLKLDTEELAPAEISDDVQTYRLSFPVQKDRKPHIYQQLS